MSNLFLNDWNVLFVTELFPLGDKACDEVLHCVQNPFYFLKKIKIYTARIVPF